MKLGSRNTKTMKVPAFGRKKLTKAKPNPRRTSKRQIKPLSRWDPNFRQLVNGTVTVGSAFLCLLMLPTRFPGMELLGISPNWLLIWVVAWSVKRTAFQGALAGVVLGLLQDAMTSPSPTHALSLGVVGALTGLLQKQRFLQEDFISIALIVFGMAALAETIFGLQLFFMGSRIAEYVFSYYQKVALASAILSSLWAPVVYYPLNRWWQQIKLTQQS